MNRKLVHAVGLAMLVVLASLSPSFAADLAGTVSGTVVDGKRNAVAGMTVRATDVVDPSKSYSTMTDAEGRFSVGSLPSGSYLVSADTVNTSWIQKDDSPIVEVSASSMPTVALVLVKTSEMTPAAVGGGGDGSNGLHIATLGFAALATVGTVVALVELDNMEEDHDRLVQDHYDLTALITTLRGDINRLYQLINERIPASPRR